VLYTALVHCVCRQQLYLVSTGEKKHLRQPITKESFQALPCQVQLMRATASRNNGHLGVDRDCRGMVRQVRPLCGVRSRWCSSGRLLAISRHYCLGTPERRVSVSSRFSSTPYLFGSTQKIHLYV